MKRASSLQWITPPNSPLPSRAPKEPQFRQQSACLDVSASSIAHSRANRAFASAFPQLSLSRPRLLVLLSLLFLVYLLPSTNAQPDVQVETLPNALAVHFECPPLQFAQEGSEEQNHDTVTFAGAEWRYVDGMPLVPYYAAVVGIPTNGMPSITILGKESVPQGSYQIQMVSPELYQTLPNQPSSRRLSQPLPPPPTYDYPSELVRLEPVGYVRQQRVARLEVFPVQYNPVTKQLLWHRMIEFRIEFPSPPMAPALTDAVEEPASIEALYQSSLLNYAQAKGWRQPRPVRKYAATPPTTREVFKFYVREDGVYQILQQRLASRSESLIHEDPRTFRLLNVGEEVPIHVEGEEDGSFDPGDAIIFFGQKLKNQKFTDENVYLLTVGDGPGKRPSQKSGKPSDEPLIPVTASRTKEHFEEDIEYDPLLLARSELLDHYFWFGLNGSQDNARRRDVEFEFPYAAAAPDEEAVVRLQLQGISHNLNQKHVVDVILNGYEVTSARFNAQTTHQVEAVAPQWAFNPNKLNFLSLIYQNDHDTARSEQDVAVDWIEFEYWRRLEAENGRLEFSSNVLPSDAERRRYRITGFRNDQIQCYEVQNGRLTARITDLQIEQVEDDYVLTFDEPEDTGFTQYYAFDAYKLGVRTVKDNPSNLRAASHRADYVMIVHEDFIETVQKLADYRSDQGHQVMVVDVDDIYDEFNSGLFDPGAIRGFLRYAYHNWTVPPSYVLLVGDAHYDYKRSIVRIHQQYYNKEYDLYPIYVPTYHGWAPESGETAMDHRFVTVSGDDPLPDIAIGRLPVQSSQELRYVIDKIINYETNSPSGEWQRRIMQVADNGADHPGDDEFERSRRALIDEIIPVSYSSLPVYLGQIGSPWETNRQIMDTLNEGVIIGEYSGHGGRETWSDEGIFRIEDIPRLDNQIFPWMITTTCLNGMFDFPHEVGRRTLSEEFLLQPTRGAIACLSATRLTYAQANSAFDRHLFQEVFVQRPPRLGTIIMNAKVAFLARAASIWVPGGEQYTLFGDPAMPLALPQVDIPTQLESVSVDPSQQIVVHRNNFITYRRMTDGTVVPEPATDFTGNLKVEVTYPNNFDDDLTNDLPVQRRFVQVTDGAFGDVRLDVSTKAIAGTGKVALFMTGDDGAAIGGTRFAVYQPVITEGPVEELTDTDLLISLQILDNAGDAGIRQVVCYWKNTVDHVQQETPMVLQTDRWYHLTKPIPLPVAGRSIRYHLEISDSEGHIIVTEEKPVQIPIGADLAVWRLPASGTPDINYTVSDGMWEIHTKVGNLGKRPVLLPFDVHFFDGNPDKDGDLILDSEALALGQTRVVPDDWLPGEDEYLQYAETSTSLENPLSSGIHQIYVWVDPQLEPDPGGKYGEVDEPYYFNNRLFKLIPVNDFNLGREDVLAYSLDRALETLIPADASPVTTISITTTDLEELKQPDLTAIPAPTTEDTQQFVLQLHSGEDTFRTDAELSIRFEVGKYRSEVMRGFGFREGTTLSPHNQERVDTALLEVIQRISIYRHVPEYDRWRQIESKPVLDAPTQLAEEPYITPARTTNHNPQALRASSIRVDPTRTHLGEWAIVFFDSEHYHVYLRRKGAQKFEPLDQVGRISSLFQDPVLGVSITIHHENPSDQVAIPFAFGDTYTFLTVEDDSGAITVADVRQTNRGDGSAFVDYLELSDTGEFITSQWLLFFTDDQNYELRDTVDRPVFYSHGSVVKGRVGVALRLPDLGLQITVQGGDKAFQFGDTISFATTDVGMIETDIRQTGSYALMSSQDTQPPKAHLWIDGVAATHGMEIAPRPEISVLVEDTNGIDPESLLIEQSKDGEGFLAVDVELAPKDPSTISIAYAPVLFRGNYHYRISAQDFNGNTLRQGENPYYEVVFIVTKDPDLEPPQVEFLANNQTLDDGTTIAKQPLFRIMVGDNETLDMSALQLSFGTPEQLFLLESGEYDQEIASNNREVTLTYAPDLINGDYVIQVEASDTVGNVTGPQQIRFTLDEAVEMANLFNVPNPFSDSTVFSFDLTQEPESVEIRIYSVSGRLLRMLDGDLLRRGHNEIYWDGRDEAGDPIANGVVFYRLIMEANGERSEEIGKAAILR